MSQQLNDRELLIPKLDHPHLAGQRSTSRNKGLETLPGESLRKSLVVREVRPIVADNGFESQIAFRSMRPRSLRLERMPTE